MRLLYRRCAGLDVHKKSISACIRMRVHSREFQSETAVFGTFTQDLEKLAQWLKEHKVKQVVMESTGVYWIPVWNILEKARGKLELTLVNPHQVRALPGRKTDQQDSERLAELHQFGLLRGSFIPPPPIRQLRDLTRRRTHLQGDRNRIINRIGRLLETVNVKLGSVISNLVGMSGTAVLTAMANGRTDPEKLAACTTGRLRASKEALMLALDGRYSNHFRWLLRQLLDQLEWLDQRLAELDVRIDQVTAQHRELLDRLCTIPGVDRITAWSLIAEVGVDMTKFPDAAHLASWAGLCPGNSESAGKRLSGRTRKGDRYLRRGLIQNAWAVSHMKDCALTAVFYRVAARRGMKRAAMAVAHRIIQIVYYVIRDGQKYRELGGDVYDRRQPARTARRLARRLEKIGYQVALKRSKDLNKNVTVKDPPEAPVCKRCAAWGIACIHARNQKLRPAADASPSPIEG